ncbi:MAG: GTPase HflX [Candidatus Eremiobacteraeota bacterium]|nr:GTPase HflX [Candidatus Eremiobacteraeota bacterium]MBC5826741.1 GTPase HflX [Candidatus Eremiobacteraeota bacterium]
MDTGDDRVRFDVEMAELEALARAAGADIVGRMVQRRPSVDPSTLLGSGKVSEIADAIKESGADAVVTLNPLRPRQRNALEKQLGQDIAVMDRSVVILDLFAAHARTSEGKLQVEVAQLRHRAANLIGASDALSRLGGGIGTRGPGETKLEADRRRIRLRITRLEKELSVVAKRRHEQRRSRASTPVIALVGYTNAGKSSLLNALSGAKVFVADQPFATLDPTLRKVRLNDRIYAVLADTVGFVSDLPKELVAAFRATLEEVVDASLLLHVIDASNPFWERQRHAVEAVLRQLGAGDKPLIIAWNKIDAAEDFSAGVDGVALSAKTGAGLVKLRAVLAAALSEMGPAAKGRRTSPGAS